MTRKMQAAVVDVAIGSRSPLAHHLAVVVIVKLIALTLLWAFFFRTAS